MATPYALPMWPQPPRKSPPYCALLANAAWVQNAMYICTLAKRGAYIQAAHCRTAQMP